MSLPAQKEGPRSRPRRRAVLVGESGRPLIELLSDVLDDVDVAVDLDEGGAPGLRGAAPDLVLVMVDRNDLANLFGRARAIAAGAPVVAILPLHDERLARQLVAFGASGCYSLDTPIERLKSGFFARGETS